MTTTERTIQGCCHRPWKQFKCSQQHSQTERCCSRGKVPGCACSEGQVAKHLGLLLLGPGLTPFGKSRSSHLVPRASGESSLVGSWSFSVGIFLQKQFLTKVNLNILVVVFWVKTSMLLLQCSPIMCHLFLLSCLMFVLCWEVN